MELSIAKEKYEYLSEVKEKLNYGKWVLFIEINKKYYEWLENTKRGNDLLANIDKIPVGSLFYA